MDQEGIRKLERKRLAWDRTAVMAALLDRRASGLDLNIGEIAKSDRRLYNAINRYFDSHDAALLAAGMDPDAVRKRAAWDKAKVVAALRDRLDRGDPMNPRAIGVSDCALISAMRTQFGSTNNAFRAAGIDPVSARIRTPMDRAETIAALRDRRARGLEANAGAIQESDIRLEGGIRRNFSSHDQALVAAGMDPAKVRKQLAWNQDKVVRCIQHRMAHGLDLHVHAIETSDASLLNAIRQRFDSHDDALRAAGVDPAVVRRRTPWDKPQVVAALHDRQTKGLGLNARAIFNSDQRLRGAIMKHFGSHDAALAAADIDPDSVRKKRPNWRKEEILGELRKLGANGIVPFPFAKFGGIRLNDAARTMFGSVQAAAEAAGLKYIHPPGRGGGIGHWTEALVLQNLRELHRDGQDLRHRHMREHRQPLFFAAKQFFGSYVNAVKQAGIDYWQMSQAQLARNRASVATTRATDPSDDPKD